MFVSFVLYSTQMGWLCDQGSWMWVMQIINNSATHPEFSVSCVLQMTVMRENWRAAWNNFAEGHSIKCLNSACLPRFLTSKACFFSNPSLGDTVWHWNSAWKKRRHFAVVKRNPFHVLSPMSKARSGMQIGKSISDCVGVKTNSLHLQINWKLKQSKHTPLLTEEQTETCSVSWFSFGYICIWVEVLWRTTMFDFDENIIDFFSTTVKLHSFVIL